MINLGDWTNDEVIVLRQILDKALRYAGLDVAQNVVALDAKIMAAVNAPKPAIRAEAEKFVNQIISGGNVLTMTSGSDADGTGEAA